MLFVSTIYITCISVFPLFLSFPFIFLTCVLSLLSLLLIPFFIFLFLLLFPSLFRPCLLCFIPSSVFHLPIFNLLGLSFLCFLFLSAPFSVSRHFTFIRFSYVPFRLQQFYFHHPYYIHFAYKPFHTYLSFYIILFCLFHFSYITSKKTVSLHFT